MTILKRSPEIKEGNCDGCYFYYDEEYEEDCAKTRHIRALEKRVNKFCWIDGFIYTEVRR